MAHKASQEDKGNRTNEDVTEEQFLKDLYIFMKKRDTPIERIPHLGFKQIDLYLMFRTVNKFGGYHQVTAQQLWKQVYNTLGGNPRSTSAATCTRRHYEKLMLPYELHIKGIHLSAVQLPESFLYMRHRNIEEVGSPPAKRRAEHFPLQNALGAMSQHHSSMFPLSPSYHKFYSPPCPYPPLPHSLMPASHVPVPQSSQSYLTCTPPIISSTEPPPPGPDSTHCHRDPLEHLRYLAKQYESLAGRSEPLNLSIKAPGNDISTNPVSSFSPLSSIKNPKFLNKPSPLYRSCENSMTSEDTSPAVSLDVDQHKRDATERQQIPHVGRVNKFIPSTGENRGRMEIEVPLSVFNNWLKMYGPQATLNGSKQLLSWKNNRTNSSVAANCEIKQYKFDDGNLRHMPTDSPGQHQQRNNNPAYDVLKNTASSDIYLLSGVKKPCSLNKSVPTVCLDLTSDSDPVLSQKVNVSANPPSSPQDLRVSKPYIAEDMQRQPESEVLQLQPTSALHLTPEEVLKLKRIINSA